MNRAESNTEHFQHQPAVCGLGAFSSSGSFLNTLLPVAFCLFTLLAACNEPFNPMQQNHQYPFSIHGYLDASQDTNWVRITAVRDSLFMDTPEPLDAAATLEHLESGHAVIMNDSLYRYMPGNKFAYNFWTDMELEPEQSYRLSVRRSDGTQSSAKVTLPPDFPDPFIKPGSGPERSSFRRDTLVTLNIEHLADVLVIYHLILHYHNIGDIPHEMTFRHIADTLNGSHYRRQVLISTLPHYQAIAGLVTDIRDSYTIKKREVKVFSAGAEWIYFSSLDKNLISLPEGTSNVEGGTGYLIGVVSNTIEYPVE